MRLKDIHNIYFIGIGGIGMSALARYFKLLKKNVAGYDKTETPLTREISDLGIEIHYTDDMASIYTFVNFNKGHILGIQNTLF